LQRVRKSENLRICAFPSSAILSRKGESNIWKG
jgi:hypothetical protein